MNKYKILWNRNDYGNIIIVADSEEQAREMFESGEYNEGDLDIKNGGMDIEEIITL